MDLTPHVLRALERLIVVANVPVLLVIGYKLFVAGATHNTSFLVEGKTWGAKMIRISPGVVCFALATVFAWASFNSGIVVTTTPEGGSLRSGFDGGRIADEGQDSLSAIFRHTFWAVTDRAIVGDNPTAEQCRKIMESSLRRVPSLEDWETVLILEANPTEAPDTLQRYYETFVENH